MKQLYITYAEQRRLHGMDSFGTPSRFIAEIPEDLVEGCGRASRFRARGGRPFQAANGRTRSGRPLGARAPQEVWRGRDPQGGRSGPAGKHPGELRLLGVKIMMLEYLEVVHERAEVQRQVGSGMEVPNSLVCVGLDPEPKKFPDRFRDARAESRIHKR